MRLPGLDGPLMIEDRFYGSNAEELDAHLHLVSDEFYDYVSLLGERFYLMPAFFGMLEDPRSYTIIAGRYFVTFDVKEIRI